MNRMKISTPDGTIIPVSQEIPARYHAHQLAAAVNWCACIEDANMVFSHYHCDGYSIWKSLYDFPTPKTVRGEYKGPVLELSSMYEQSFFIDWKGVDRRRLSLKHLELYYATGIDNTAHFPGGLPAITMDVHYEPWALDAYAPDFPLLARFMDKVHAGTPAMLFDGNQFSTPQMDRVLQSLMRFDYLDALAPLYYDSHVNILLIQLLELISGYNPDARKYSARDKEHAAEAGRLLGEQKNKSLTINRLAALLGTNPYKLKITFKAEFGTTIGQYRTKIFMDHALELLQAGGYTIDDVALALGYGSQQSFSTAFRNYFKFTPGSVLRRGR